MARAAGHRQSRVEMPLRETGYDAALQHPDGIAVDQEEAYRVGRESRALRRRRPDRLHGRAQTRARPHYHCATFGVPLSEIGHQEKKIPDEMSERMVHSITAAFVDYALPLIGGELPPYARLARHAVSKKL